MMQKIRQMLNPKERESGSADLIVTLATIPFAVFLILAMIDISLYMNTRAAVESATRDGVRQAAMWGGAGNTRLNTSGQSTAANIHDRLWQSGSCTQSHCKRSPVVKCSPAKVGRAGQKITCSVKYYPSSVVPGASLLGFAAITNSPFTVKEYAISETGY